MIEFLFSPRFYWLFRVGWFERAFFYTVRFIAFLFSRRDKKILDLALFGFDFSKWQGLIDFAKVLAFGTKFLILRASYGIVGDEKFVEYMRTAPDFFTGKLSVYGYYVPDADPVLQAMKLLSVIEPYRRYIRRVYGDFEFPNSGSWSAPLYWKRYAETIINAGYEFGVYTRKTWWDSRVGSFAAWFGQFPGWFAQYAPQLTLIPRGWTKASIHQKGTPAIGNEVGTQSREVDYNIADDEFYAAEYGDVVEPPPNGGTMPENYVKLTPTSPLEYRSVRGNTNFPTIPHIFGVTSLTSRIQPGNTAKALPESFYVYTADVLISGILQAKAGDKWWVIYEANGSPLVGWVAEIHKGIRYLTTQEIGSEPPPAGGTPATIEMVLAPGSTVTIKDSDGNILWSGTA